MVRKHECSISFGKNCKIKLCFLSRSLFFSSLMISTISIISIPNMPLNERTLYERTSKYKLTILVLKMLFINTDGVYVEILRKNYTSDNSYYLAIMTLKGKITQPPKSTKLLPLALRL